MQESITFTPEVVELLDDVNGVSNPDLHLVSVTWYKAMHTTVRYLKVVVRC